MSTNDWPTGIAAITLFVEDLGETRDFYQRTFEQSPFFEDDTSAVFKFGDTLINLLHISQADELVNPAPAAGNTGIRAVYTLSVDDVDACCAELTARGVGLLNGPMDRPWGIHTASFTDPAGHIWELSAPLGR